ncbi:MAG: type II toxin-antitoxin system Phd/YefM family antitoxin [Planctomycetes bacterium]|nr:type II toxin-antitoxin system Phd/YefM family antitoxin [Planctomycetota bacterium]
MKVINLEEAKSNLERYANECQSSPVIVTVDGKPTFEMLPIRSDDPDFIDRLIEENPAFRKLLEDRRRESDLGRVSPLEVVRERLEGHTS